MDYFNSMRHLSFVIIAFLTWFFCLFAHGQSYRKANLYKDDPNVFGKNNISISVFPLIQRGFELNYDRKIIDKHWLKFAPVYYKMENYSHSGSTNLRSAQGFGFKFQHKYFPYNYTKKPMGLFLSYGPSFQRFNLETKGRETVKFDKYGLECVIGLRRVILDAFYFELYGGLATDYLKNRNEEKVDWDDVLKNHNALWFDYGIRGNYIVFGINIGILF